MLTLFAILALDLSKSPRPMIFEDRTSELGLSLGNDAACWIDLDNDGWAELVSAGTVWKNASGKGFTKLASVAGACVAADFDNDGFADLFSYPALKLYRNLNGKGFEEAPLPTLPPTVSRGACWGDFNGDGFVDLYIGGYEHWDKGVTYPSFILMNKGGRSFEHAWSDAAHRARGVTACDFDRDGDLDVYVSDYRLQPNRLWVNDGKGTFKDLAMEYNAVATSPGFAGGHSIGAAWGDFDSDGEIDLFAGNFAHVDNRGDQPKSRFLRNLGKAGGYKFEDKGTCGVFYQESYASPAAGDFDNDGALDLLFSTVYATASFGRPNHPVLFRNEGGFKFADATEASGLAKLGATYQASWADFDHDGDLDIATDGKLFVNRGSNGHWIEVRLVGDGKTVNGSAIGSQVRVKLARTVLTRQVEAGTGEGNQNDLVLHFGLGASKGPVDVEVAWPGGQRQTLRRMRVDRLLTIKR